MIEKNKYGIAKWRIDSEEERSLACLADESLEGKSAYVEYYRVNDSEYFNGGLPMIEHTLKHYGVTVKGDERREIFEDMIYSLHRFGFSFEEYFQYKLQAKNAVERSEFVSDKKRHEYYATFNTLEGKRLLNNKATALERLRSCVGRDFMFISARGGVLQRDEIDKFLTEHGDVIVKPVSESCGRGVFLVKKGEMDTDTLLANISSSDVVIEEFIYQSSEMASFHSKSVNTVRMICFACGDGKHFIQPIFRTGKGLSVVDNTGAGGIFASVNLESGIVSSDGIDGTLNVYEKHPDTGVKYQGFELPDWNGALHYVDDLMALVPECRCVGWDLAHTDDGWVVVEGNPFPQLGIQMITGVGLKAEFEKYISLL